MDRIEHHRLAVCSWSLGPKSPTELARLLKTLDLPRTQLALMPVLGDPAWAHAPATLRAEGIEIVSGMFGTIGEDYTTLETIRATGGVAPDQHWPANRERAQRAAALAQDMGLRTVSFHAGFIPHDRENPQFATLLARLTDLADLFASHGLDLLLETGQETAGALTELLVAAERPNLGVNFDPANMVLYGMGDPIAALRLLMPYVRQVHLKDANPAPTPGDWGSEQPVGKGTVDWRAFLSVLSDAGYTGHLVIEREAGATRMEDIATAVAYIRSLD